MNSLIETSEKNPTESFSKDTIIPIVVKIVILANKNSIFFAITFEAFILFILFLFASFLICIVLISLIMPYPPFESEL
jgi:ABC-type molybdate transport system substrate-binding protein